MLEVQKSLALNLLHRGSIKVINEWPLPWSYSEQQNAQKIRDRLLRNVKQCLLLSIVFSISIMLGLGVSYCHELGLSFKK
jgi:hypothetical protein